ncbi:MAG: thioredoxin family protein [Syntrophales bacterium]|nr:thioredoxin family protein [Syntrophales bacterium]
MEIKIFGPGCARCGAVEKMVKEVLEETRTEATITKVKDVKEYAKHGVLSTPAVMVNGKVKSMGKIPTKEEIASWLKEQ